jgi:glycosidase
MRILHFLFYFLVAASLAHSQIVRLEPSEAGPGDRVKLVFDASQGNAELTGASKVYIHHGVVTSGPEGTSWQYVVGNWGQDDGIGLMTRVSGESDLWEIEFTPTLRQYFGVPSSLDIFRIACVFRSADGNIKGTTAPGNYGWGSVTPNLDFFIDLNVKDFISITQPFANEGFFQQGESFRISGVASSEVSSMRILVDEGNGFETRTSVDSGSTIDYDFEVNSSRLLRIRIEAIIKEIEYEEERLFNVVIRTPTIDEPRPSGLQQGVNYNDDDPTKVTLVLLAPGKNFVYVVGDFSDWLVKEELQMKRDGDYFWVEINNLEPKKPYVFQYWIDGEIKVGDPYAELVVDPWNDQWIPDSVFPDLPPYGRTEFGLATVLETGQDKWNWADTESTWQRPDADHLVIYELHIRDFLNSHSYKDLIDTIDYIKRLGVNAIELMPINEFEGNSSWGYNPSYYFAVDKYYGTKNQLKEFIQVCHQNGIAVILDVVLNHAFGQSPMVMMYFDPITRKPTSNSPWFNVDHVGPYEWGYDFDHESEYTKQFVDDFNRFWLEEFHFDGYRFDFTKGFTNHAPGGSIDGFDQSRINILSRMADRMWEVDPEAYVILEHWGPGNEEAVLAGLGMHLWRNKSYDYIPATTANSAGNFSNSDATSHVTFYNSHDERRIAEHCLAEGRSSGSYNIRKNEIMYERVKMAAAFLYLQPGPKMMWQFDELGYDIHIDFNGRTGRKPYPWGSNGLGYYEDPLRQHIYTAYSEILKIRNLITPQKLASATKRHVQTGEAKRLSFDTPDIDLVVIGNFGIVDRSIPGGFTKTGTWYNYFSGDSISVSNVNQPMNLLPGEWHIFTNQRISEGLSNVVETYQNPVTITPFPFTADDMITIRFDATKASNAETQGLRDADKVYFHSGVILESPQSDFWSNTVGTLQDDGIGLMQKVSDNVWEISISPRAYYQLEESEDPFRLAMYFRDAQNENFGYGFRGSVIFFEVDDTDPIVEIIPPSFQADEEITIIFNARKGNQELVGADKVYLHSGVGMIETNSPQNSAWQNVQGNWGNDDGVGLMSRVPGQVEKWQITITPRDYYNMPADSHPHWIATVFRNADGNIKASAAPGAIQYGFVHTNGDIFIQNQATSSVVHFKNTNISLYPNPNNGQFTIEGIESAFNLEIFDLKGSLVFQIKSNENEVIDVSSLSNGMYIYQVRSNETVLSGRIVIER